MAQTSAAVYTEALRFYARQMRLLDNLDIDGYAETFTEDAVTYHASHDLRLEGRTALIEHAEKALPRYRDVVARHWNDHYLIDENPDGDLTVSYCSLVTLTDGSGGVRFESTFAVTDVLVRIGGTLFTRSRTIVRDRPAAG